MFQSLYNLVAYLVTEIGRLFAEHWYFLVPLVVGAAAVGTLLPQPRRFPLVVRAGLLALTLILAVVGISAATAGGPGSPNLAATIEAILFYGFSFVAVVSGIMLVTQTQPARAALSFTLVVLSTCGLFLLLAAPFLFAATIIVYAGAIIVTFLFVLMLAQQTGLDDADLRSREPLLSIVTGFVLVGTLFYLIDLNRRDGETRPSREAEAAGKNDAVGRKKRAEQAAAQLARLTQLAGRAARAPSAEVLKAILDSASEEGAEKPIYLIFKEKLTTIREDTAGLSSVAIEKMNKRIEDEIATPWQMIRKDDLAAMGRQQSYLQELETIGQEVLSLPGVSSRALSTFSGPVGLSPQEIRKGPDGRPAMPAENPTYLGKSLFTDYLLPVELGGLLLLVAVVGAIVIGQRQEEQAKETA
jgi:NADH:ubiquinone oxidoreductase subunit 6 (subunit J)